MYNKAELKELVTCFWEEFAKYTAYYSHKKGRPIEWMLYKTGIKGLELKFDIDPKFVKCIIESNARNEDRRLDIFIELTKYKPIIEEGFKSGLIWDDDCMLKTGKPVMRIYCELTGLNFHNRDNWPGIFNFMAGSMFRLQTNFQEILPVLEEKFKYNQFDQ
jgi:hypothetical protein